jgi:hypothetical protein
MTGPIPIAVGADRVMLLLHSVSGAQHNPVLKMHRNLARGSCEGSGCRREVLSHASLHCTVLFCANSTAQHCTAVRRSTAQHSTAKHSTAQHNTAQQ